jgi:hypothetical protein
LLDGHLNIVECLLKRSTKDLETFKLIATLWSYNQM